MTRRGGSNMAASPSVYRDARQYHHFVPCFIVRNWQVPQGASDGPSTSSGGPQATRIRESRKARGERRLAESVQRRQALAEECIKMYDVQASTLHLCTPLNRAYGIFDMYKDESGGQPNVYHVEMLFSKLESQAARILREIQRSIIDTNTPPRALTPVTLSRVDVNTLRKFLFLLEYRSPACSNRFVEGRFNASTRLEVERFMQRHGFMDRRAVWLFTLQNVLETDHWQIVYNDKIMPWIRRLYVADMCRMELAFFVPPEGHEFVLTDNGLGFGEGVHIPPGLESNCTKTFVLSPRLLIMHRDHIMDLSYQEDRRRIGGPSMGSYTSLFRNFPRAFVDVQPQGFVPLSSGSRGMGAELGDRTLDDRLTFHIQQLTADQTARVNYLLLVNAPRFFTFKSTRNLLSALRYSENAVGAEWLDHGAADKARHAALIYAGLKLELSIKDPSALAQALAPSTSVSMSDGTLGNSSRPPNRITVSDIQSVISLRTTAAPSWQTESDSSAAPSSSPAVLPTNPPVRASVPSGKVQASHVPSVQPKSLASTNGRHGQYESRPPQGIPRTEMGSHTVSSRPTAQSRESDSFNVKPLGYRSINEYTSLAGSNPSSHTPPYAYYADAYRSSAASSQRFVQTPPADHHASVQPPTCNPQPIRYGFPANHSGHDRTSVRAEAVREPGRGSQGTVGRVGDPGTRRYSGGPNIYISETISQQYDSPPSLGVEVCIVLLLVALSVIVLLVLVASLDLIDSGFAV